MCCSALPARPAAHLAVQAVGKALREREQALLTVSALENELRTKRRGISSLEESGQQVGGSLHPHQHMSIEAGDPIFVVKDLSADTVKEEATLAARFDIL